MKRFARAFLISCWVRIFHLWQFFINFFKYYLWNWKFFWVDLTIFGFYFFQNPFGLIRKFGEKHPEKQVGAYGETEFSSMEKILNEFNISRDLVFADLGSGRGRLSFWLRLVRGQKYVIGVEQFPLFVERAKKIQNWFTISNLHFLNGLWDEISLQGAEVVYLYGSALEPDVIGSLAKRLLTLPRGTKVITTSYSLDEFFPGKFKLEAKTKARFIWGNAYVYLQSVST